MAISFISFQQHTAYQIDTDLDGDDQTIEITMFDNHFLWRRKKDIDYYDKTEGILPAGIFCK